MTLADYGKSRKMGRLLKNGKMLVVPIDDSLIFGPYDGLYNLEKTIVEIEKSKPSAILGYSGSLTKISCLDLPLILNVTASTVTGTHVSKIPVGNIFEALTMDADGVAVHINYTSEQENEMLRQLSEIALDADRYGMPVIAISYPRKSLQGKDYNYDDIDEKTYTNLICHCVRTSVELGADIVKTQYTGSEASFERVINSALGHPVIIAGGPLKDVKDAYKMAKAVMNVGAAGISYGRNVFNAKNIFAFISGIKAIVFDGADVEDALSIYQRCVNVRMEKYG